MSHVSVQSFQNGTPTRGEVYDNIVEVKHDYRTVRILDAVYVTPEGKVAKASALDPEHVCIGIISAMESMGYCKVLTHGALSGFDRDKLDPGCRYYLAEDAGKITKTPPTKAGSRVQFLGIAVSESKLLLDPALAS